MNMNLSNPKDPFGKQRPTPNSPHQTPLNRTVPAPVPQGAPFNNRTIYYKNGRPLQVQEFVARFPLDTPYVPPTMHYSPAPNTAPSNPHSPPGVWQPPLFFPSPSTSKLAYTPLPTSPHQTSLNRAVTAPVPQGARLKNRSIDHEKNGRPLQAQVFVARFPLNTPYVFPTMHYSPAPNTASFNPPSPPGVWQPRLFPSASTSRLAYIPLPTSPHQPPLNRAVAAPVPQGATLTNRTIDYEKNYRSLNFHEGFQPFQLDAPSAPPTMHYSPAPNTPPSNPPSPPGESQPRPSSSPSSSRLAYTPTGEPVSPLQLPRSHAEGPKETQATSTSPGTTRFQGASSPSSLTGSNALPNSVNYGWLSYPEPHFPNLNPFPNSEQLFTFQHNLLLQGHSQRPSFQGTTSAPIPPPPTEMPIHPALKPSKPKQGEQDEKLSAEENHALPSEATTEELNRSPTDKETTKVREASNLSNQNTPRPSLSRNPNKVPPLTSEEADVLAAHIAQYYEWSSLPPQAPNAQKKRDFKPLPETPLSQWLQMAEELFRENPSLSNAKQQIKGLAKLRRVLQEAPQPPEERSRHYRKAEQALTERMLSCFATANFSLLLQEAQKQIPVANRFKPFHNAEKTQPIPTFFHPLPTDAPSSRTKLEELEASRHFLKLSNVLRGTSQGGDYKCCSFIGSDGSETPQFIYRKGVIPQSPLYTLGGLEEAAQTSLETLHSLMSSSGTNPSPPKERFYHERQSGPYCQTTCLNNYLGGHLFSPEIMEALSHGVLHGSSHYAQVRGVTTQVTPFPRHKADFFEKPVILSKTRQALHQQLNQAIEEKGQHFRLPQTEIEALKTLLDIDTWTFPPEQKLTGTGNKSESSGMQGATHKANLKQLIASLNDASTDRILFSYTRKDSSSAHIVALRKASEKGRWVLLDGNMPPIELNLEAYITEIFDNAEEINIQAPKAFASKGGDKDPRSPLKHLKQYQPEGPRQVGYLPKATTLEKDATLLSKSTQLVKMAQQLGNDQKYRNEKAEDPKAEASAVQESVLKQLGSELREALDRVSGEAAAQDNKALYQAFQKWPLSPATSTEEANSIDYLGRWFQRPFDGYNLCKFLEKNTRGSQLPPEELQQLLQFLPQCLSEVDQAALQLRWTLQNSPTTDQLKTSIQTLEVPLKRAGSLIAFKAALKNYFTLTSRSDFMDAVKTTIQRNKEADRSPTDYAQVHEELNRYLSLLVGYYTFELATPWKKSPKQQHIEFSLSNALEDIEHAFFQPILASAQGELRTLNPQSFRSPTLIYQSSPETK